MHLESRWLRVFALGLVFGCAPLGALAQAAEPEEPAAAEPEAAEPTDLGAIEEIVITTQKRAQNLQDVPISVTAITGDEIAKLGIGESVDIAAQTPGLKIGFPSGETNTPAIFLRGVGLNDYNANSNGSVGWYMDEVYISQVTAQNFQLFDLERVEVARGPQGTLYGRNTTGGLVSFISEKPDHEDRGGYFTASYGKWDAVKLEGALGGPITDTLAARLSLAFNRADGYIDNEFAGGRDNNDAKNWAGRLAFSWRPSETIDVLFNVHGAQNRSLAAQYEHQGTLDPGGSGADCSTAQIRSDVCIDALGYRDGKNNERGEYNKEGELDVDTFGTYLRADFEIGELTLTSLTAYEWVDKLFEEDTDASPNQLIEIDYVNDGWEFSQELRLGSDGDNYHWQAGLYYLQERVRVDNFLDLFRALRPLIESVDPFLYPGGFDPAGAAIGAPAFFSKTHYVQEVKSAAAFGQLDWDFTEKLRGTIGGRFTWEAREFEEDVQFQEPTFAAPVFSIRDEVDFKEWSAKIGLDYKPIEDLLLFASISRGFKSGGFSGAFAFSAAELPPFDPETVWAYEAGAKWEGFDRRLRLNGSVFYYDYQDLQVFTTVNLPPVPVTILDNAGTAKIYGSDIELELAPMDGLSIALGAEFLHTELVDYENDNPALVQAYEGNELVFAPGVSLNGRMRYERKVGSGLASVQTDFNYQDRVYFETGNDRALSQGGYGVWNARAAYAFEDSLYEVAVFARNLLDNNYLTSAFKLSGFGFNEQMWGHPRTYGAELTARF